MKDIDCVEKYLTTGKIGTQTLYLGPLGNHKTCAESWILLIERRLLKTFTLT